MRKYYFVVEKYGNWLKTREKGFSEKAFKDRQSCNIIRAIKPKDIFVFYISSRISALGGIAKVASEVYTRSDLYWDDFYNLRFKVIPEVILEEHQFVDFSKLIKQLHFVKNKNRWANYVYHSIRILNTNDFHVLESAIKKAKKQ